MDFFEFFKAFILGVVEGITEWLPISSTGHMILVDKFIELNVSDAFKEMFFVVIQLGAVLAVVVLYFDRLMPITIKKGIHLKEGVISIWLKIIVACIPAIIVGVFFDDQMNALFYNYQTVSIMLILFGIFFIIVENINNGKKPQVNSIAEISYKMAVIIGMFQLIAAVFPGTSRSGATILGAILFGVSRTVATEFTFFLAVPVMFGASLLKILKFGFVFTASEIIILAIGMVTAFVVSIIAIKFLTGYIKKHDFKLFGWYRIALGCIVLLYFMVWGG